MQEALHFAFALLMAPFVWTVITATGNAGNGRVGLVIVLACATLVRPTWGFVLVPVVWIATSRNGTVRRLTTVAGVVLLTACAYAFMMWMAAPFPRSQTLQLLAGSSDPVTAAGTIANRVIGNLRTVFRDKAVAEALWHAEAFVLFGITSWYWLAARRKGAGYDPVRSASAVGALLMLCLLAAILVFYEFGSWRAFRVLASPMLLIMFLGLAARARWAHWMLAAHLVCTPIYLRAFHDLHEPRFRADRTQITYMRRQVDPVLQFRADASPWQNTVLVHVDAVEYPLVGLPPGIGMTVVLDWRNLPRPPRSAYLLLRPKDREAIGSSMRLERLGQTVYGTLYRNLDARGL
jgi:hypothetical protein